MPMWCVHAGGARLARLGREINGEQAGQIQTLAGTPLEQLAAALLRSIDPDLNHDRAIKLFQLDGLQIADAGKPIGPTEAQLDAAEEAAMAEALKPFSDPKLRETLLAIKGSLGQVIDEVTPDTLINAGFSQSDKDKAQSVMGELRAFCETHKDQIEALQLLYQKPHRAGLRYGQVKDLARQLNRAPFFVDPAKPESVVKLWQLQRQAEPEHTQGEATGLVDLIALVRHALHPQEPIAPLQTEITQRYREWLEEQANLGIAFTAEQREWLDMIKNHIATSLMIDRDDFQETPFAERGGLGQAYQLFGDKLDAVLAELNDRLAA